MPRAAVSLGNRRDWVFGITGPRRRPQRPIAARWQSGTWRDTAVPFRGVLGGFVGGDSVSRSNAWAVGFVRTAGYVPISAHWNGQRWTGVRVPDQPGLNAALTDVALASSRRVWAVGSRTDSGRVRPVAMRWRAGTGWRDKALDTGAGESGLTAVSASPGAGVWAAGWRTIDGRPRPMLARRGSGGWVLAGGASLPPGTAMLTDLAWRSPTEGYAAGFLFPVSGGTVPILQRWNGSAWSLVDLPWADGFSAVLRSVAVDGDGSLTVAGTRLANDQRLARGFVARRVAGTWAVTQLGSPAASHSEMTGVAANGQGAFAVGFSGNRGIVLATCGNGLAGGLRGIARLGEPAPIPDDATLEERPLAANVGAQSRASALPAPPVPQGTLGGIRVREIADEVGLNLVTSSFGGDAADFNRDGWRDLLISRHGEAPPQIMLGGPNGFRRLRDSPFEPRDVHGCAAADVDDDGFPDVYCAHGADRGAKMKENGLYLRPGSGSGFQAAAAFDVLDTFGRGPEGHLHAPQRRPPSRSLRDQRAGARGRAAVNE